MILALRKLCRPPRRALAREPPNGGAALRGFAGCCAGNVRYPSSPSCNWSKTKCPHWKRINLERHKLFEGPRKPEPTEAQKTLGKKCEELARALERLRAPGHSARAAQARDHSGAGNG
jgi:hypothetical protein